jgi:hypothetical protein
MAANWLNAVENPKAITSLFEVVPSLEDVEISALNLDHGGPTMTLSILLRDSPTTLPVRWQARHFNATAIQLQVLGIESMKLEGWSTDNRVAITIEGSPGSLTLRAMGSGSKLRLQCMCGWVNVAGVTPYEREKSAKSL